MTVSVLACCGSVLAAVVQIEGRIGTLSMVKSVKMFLGLYVM